MIKQTKKNIFVKIKNKLFYNASKKWLKNNICSYVNKILFKNKHCGDGSERCFKNKTPNFINKKWYINIKKNIIYNADDFYGSIVLNNKCSTSATDTNTNKMTFSDRLNFKNKTNLKNKSDGFIYHKYKKNNQCFKNKTKLRSKLAMAILIFIICLTTLSFINSNKFVYANSSAKTEAEQKLSDNIFDQLSKINFSELDKIIFNSKDSFSIFGNGNFKDKVVSIVNGTYFSSYDSLFSAVISLVFEGFVEFLPIFLTIIGIAILSVIVGHLKTGGSNGGVGDVIHFVCFAAAVILISSIVVQVMQTTSAALGSMKGIMEGSFPIMLTLLTAVGAVSSVAIYKPVVAILTGGVSFVFTNVLYPMFIIAFIFVLINNLSSTVKLKQFNDFISSSFKWITGFVLMLFSSFMVVQGISAGKFDSVSVKATKFAIKSYVPIIGGFVGDGFDFIVMGSVLIKNAVGVGVLVLILTIVIVPIIKIVVLKLAMQLLAAVVEPVGNGKITGFLSSTSKILTYPIAIIIGVSFMFLLTVTLMMSTANIF